MKKLFRHMILMACAAILAVTGLRMSASADGLPVFEEISAQETQPMMDPDESALFELINAARRDPLGMAESLGMNRNKILMDLPELREILLDGLPALKFDHRLYRTATDHVADMVINSYYSYESLDGQSVDQRISNAGYTAFEFGESLGLLVFNNFIKSENAVHQIFKNIFQNELDPSFDGQRNILNPRLEEMGVGLQGGVFYFGQYAMNAYAVVCDFGASIEPYEMQLLTLVNQLRNSPAAVTRNFGVDVQDVLDLFPEYAAFYADGLPPLIYNSHLYAAADTQIDDMLENNYWGHISPGGITPLMRIQAQGYMPTWIAESKYRLSTCDKTITPANTIQFIFRNMFSNAFKSGNRDGNMLSGKAKEAGMRVVAGESNLLSSICGDKVHITVCDYAASNENKTDADGDNSGKQALTGVVYADLNENGLYDAGEGLSDVALTVQCQEDNSADKIVFTGDTGSYTVFLRPGRYCISVSPEVSKNMQVRTIEIDAANVWLPFLFEQSDLSQ